MTVRMENIDELRRRTSVSYEAAKDALEKCNDDILEALVYLEKQNMVRPNAAGEHKTSFWTKVKKVIRKGNSTKFIISKRENVLVSIPVTLAVVITALMPDLTVIALLVALLMGNRIRFEGKDVRCDKANEVMNKVSDSVDSAKRKLAENSDSRETAR